MEVVFTAIMGELANRSISFLVDKYSIPTAPIMEEKLHSLQRLLLRVRVIVEEAEGRHIANQAMMQQLNIMRKEMYRGYYTLDNFRSQANGEEKAKDHEVSHSFALSKFNPAKRLSLSTGDTQSEKELQQVLHNLDNIIVDASEFVTFFKNYPPLYRQPYSMHLLLDKCMFGRQMEMDRIMNFLMQIEPPNTKSVGVLPIVGPAAAGKSTLVSHICNNERVRNLFSQIVLVSEDDLEFQILNFKDGRVIKHRNNACSGKEAMLVIIELPKDIDEATWKNLYLVYAGHIARGSKIIITSRSSKIIGFGTTQPLVLSFLPREAFWYFFKVLTFGSADPEEQPKLASIAMQISKELPGSFITAKVIAGLLRSNLNAQFWSKALKSVRLYVQTNISMFGEHPSDLFRENKPTFRQMANADFCVVHNRHQTSFDGEEVPKITLQDVLIGSAKCRGRIEVLVWRSQIPPYRSYIYSCEIQRPGRMAIKKGSEKKAI